MTQKYVVVGVGGVGTRVANNLTQYLAHAFPGNAEVILVDGDSFEPKNAERQEFVNYGYKAISKAEELQAKFPTIRVEAIPMFLSQQNVGQIVTENTTVFACVDNYASRKLISDRCLNLENALLISGGNDYHEGGVQLHLRRDGENVTPPITYLHPEIGFPQDKNPADLGCEELAAAGEPQLLFANMTVATEMVNAMWAAQNSVDPPFSEAHFDLKRGTRRTYRRHMKVKNDDPEDTQPDIGLADRGGVAYPEGRQDQN